MAHYIKIEIQNWLRDVYSMYANTIIYLYYIRIFTCRVDPSDKLSFVLFVNIYKILYTSIICVHIHIKYVYNIYIFEQSTLFREFAVIADDF